MKVFKCKHCMQHCRNMHRRTSIDSVPDDLMEADPPLPEVVVGSQLTVIPDLWTWRLVGIAITVTSFKVCYAWNASFALNTSEKFLWLQSDTTIFMISLSYVATVLVSALITATCGQIR